MYHLLVYRCQKCLRNLGSGGTYHCDLCPDPASPQSHLDCPRVLANGLPTLPISVTCLTCVYAARQSRQAGQQGGQR